MTVKPLGLYQLGPRSSSFGPTKGTPPPGDTLHANRSEVNTPQVDGLARIPGLTQAPHMRILSHRISTRDPPRLIPLRTNIQSSLVS